MAGIVSHFPADEIKRSRIFTDMFAATVPHAQTVMPTNDQWRDNRRLMADTMSPQFLQNVAAPQEHAVFASLLGLWRTKCNLAQDHAFEVSSDIDEVLLDAIIAVAFGTSTGVTQAQQKLLSSLPKLGELSAADSAPAIFPTAVRPPTYEAITRLAASTEIGLKVRSVPPANSRAMLTSVPSFAFRCSTPQIRSEVLPKATPSRQAQGSSYNRETADSMEEVQ